VSIGKGLPSGTVTLLLGDVEQSTRHWEADPAGMREAMATLNAALAEVVAESGGAMPVEQGEGDSFVAAFERGSAAINCALALQLRLQGGSLRVRLGLHTGEIDVVDNRYQGTTIIRAARLRDIAHGGQVVLSSATRDLVADVLPDGKPLPILTTPSPDCRRYDRTGSARGVDPSVDVSRLTQRAVIIHDQGLTTTKSRSS
jgi:class 3 adenylate cyclase